MKITLTEDGMRPLNYLSQHSRFTKYLKNGHEFLFINNENKNKCYLNVYDSFKLLFACHALSILIYQDHQ
jgi:hypothetical protein